MKIGYCGAGGTGKSTLAKIMSGEFKMDLVESPSRACFAKHNVTTEDAQKAMTPDARWALQSDIFKAIDKQITTIKEGIFERTHVDNLGYATIQCKETLDNKTYLAMEQMAIKGLKSFDAVIYFPIYAWDEEATDDKMRTQSLPQRYLHQGFVHNFLLRNNIPHHVMPDITPDRRLRQIRIALRK